MQKQEFVEEMVKIFAKISLTYGLPEAGIDFVAHMGNCIRKYFGTLSPDQIADAFERNSIGALNEYLPKNGFGKSENTVKFTIPDITRILKAYMKFKKLDQSVAAPVSEWPVEKKSEIRHQFCAYLFRVFETYMHKNERLPISTPRYCCEVLKNQGLIEQSDICNSEPGINIKIGDMMRRRLKNEYLIFTTFDRLIGQGISLEKKMERFLHEFDGHVSSEIKPNYSFF